MELILYSEISQGYLQEKQNEYNLIGFLILKVMMADCQMSQYLRFLSTLIGTLTSLILLLRSISDNDIYIFILMYNLINLSVLTQNILQARTVKKVLNEQVEHTDTSYYGQHDLRNQINQASQCGKVMKSTEFSDQDEEEKLNFQNDNYITIKQVEKKLQQLYNYELVYNNNQDRKITTMRLDELWNMIFKKVQLFMMNKMVEVEGILPEGQQFHVDEDFNILTNILIYTITKLCENGIKQYVIQHNHSIIKGFKQVEVILKILGQEKLDLNQILQTIEEFTIQRRIRALLSKDTDVEVDVKLSQIVYRFKEVGDSCLITETWWKIADNELTKNQVKPSTNELKSLLGQRVSINQTVSDIILRLGVHERIKYFQFKTRSYSEMKYKVKYKNKNSKKYSNRRSLSEKLNESILIQKHGGSVVINLSDDFNNDINNLKKTIIDTENPIKMAFVRKNNNISNEKISNDFENEIIKKTGNNLSSKSVKAMNQIINSNLTNSQNTILSHQESNSNKPKMKIFKKSVKLNNIFKNDDEIRSVNSNIHNTTIENQLRSESLSASFDNFDISTITNAHAKKPAFYIRQSNEFSNMELNLNEIEITNIHANQNKFINTEWFETEHHILKTPTLTDNIYGHENDNNFIKPTSNINQFSMGRISQEASSNNVEKKVTNNFNGNQKTKIIDKDSNAKKKLHETKKKKETIKSNLAHICSLVVNIDDEQCVLNMHKNLFKRKLNVDLNTCKDSNALIKTMNSIVKCEFCKDKEIILICDQMLENEYGSEIIRNVIRDQPLMKLRCQGLTSSEDIQVKQDFMSAGITKLYIKPLKVNILQDIMNTN